jgi:hypothetical protein
MLLYEDSHITHENGNLKNALLHLLPFHYVIRNIFLQKFDIFKKVFCVKRKSLEWQVLKEYPHGEWFQNLIFLL